MTLYEYFFHQIVFFSLQTILSIVTTITSISRLLRSYQVASIDLNPLPPIAVLE